MSALSALRELNHEQRHTVLASFLGWTLDAFDYFLFTFVIVAISKEFHADRTDVTLGVLLTLAARPIGALIFGRLADRYGRRPVLMIDVILFSVFELATAFAPSLTMLLIMRFMFGVAMGGEWGIGASLAMETIPPKSRGLVSGLLQSGYPVRLFPRRAGELAAGRSHRLARFVCRRCCARVAGALHPTQSSGVARMGSDTGQAWHEQST
jgi:SHS family lactate transporter-like MFS transporter